jgi:predicted DNA-binding protein (MmcQ/YjbR family)
MDNECIREFCLKLPHVTESVAWGHDLLFWVGDKAIGGRVFAAVMLDAGEDGVLSFHCGEERFRDLLEIDGIVPAPYSAKQFWVLVKRWDAMRAPQFEEELRRAYELIYAKLPKRTLNALALPEKERAKLIREKRKLLTERERVKKGTVK